MAFSACNKDDDNPVTPDNETVDPPKEETVDPAVVLTGAFRDSEVQGLSFTTATQTGITNEKGEFSYLQGETITFKVGELTLGSAIAETLITPISLVKTVDASATIESVAVQNIAAFLQTLDADSDHSNGITITQNMASAIGIQNIDFGEPVESILADIVLNVAQNQGTALQIVYPGQAAENMAAALNISYDAPPNFAISHFMPTLKAFFQGYYKNHTPASAVYKSTFDSEGKLLSIDVISRYSGNQLFSFVFSGYAADGQPSIGVYTTYNANSRFGSSSSNSTFDYGLELSYDQDHRLVEFGELFNGQMSNLTEFTAFDEDNRPLSYFRDVAQEGVDEFVITIDATYENGLINTSRRNYYREYNQGDFSSITNTTRELTYAYNQYANLTNIDFTRVFEDTFTQNGEVTNSVNEAIHNETFSYGNSNKLVSYQSFEQATSSNGNNYTQEWTRAYDANERLDSYTDSSTLNRQSTADYEEGIRLSSQDFFNGLLTYESINLADGSSTFTSYYYDENNILYLKEIYERGSDFRTVKRTDVYYFEGAIDFIQENLYDANGYVYFVEAVFADGTLWFTEEWEHDANGLLSKISVYLSDGVLYAIYLYEDGILTTGEFYDADGNLFETVDYTSSGKSEMDISKMRKSFEDGKRVMPRMPSAVKGLRNKSANQSQPDFRKQLVSLNEAVNNK